MASLLLAVAALALSATSLVYTVMLLDLVKRSGSFANEPRTHRHTPTNVAVIRDELAPWERDYDVCTECGGVHLDLEVPANLDRNRVARDVVDFLKRDVQVSQ